MTKPLFVIFHIISQLRNSGYIKKMSVWGNDAFRGIFGPSSPSVSGCLESCFMTVKTLCCLQGNHTHT